MSFKILSQKRISSVVIGYGVLTFILMLLVLPTCCLSTPNVNSSDSIFWESESKYQPSGCRRTTRPTYILEDSTDAHRLVVTIPEKVSRKNLKIDVDYNEGHIEVFGWWFESRVRGEPARKMCMYGRWNLDPDLFSDEAIVSSDLVSVYDIFMSLQDQQLVLSVPKAIDTSKLPESSLEPTPILSNIDGKDKQTRNHTSIVLAYGTTLWKRLRGLGRLKDQARNHYYHLTNTTLAPSTSWDVDLRLPPSSLAYEKYREDALEEFLAYALSAIDKHSNQ